jgi:hypothetical protein
MPLMSIKLLGNRALVLPHISDSAILLREAPENEKLVKSLELEKLGLFEVASPDFNRFYPNTTPQDFEPREEEFVKPVFRMLSATIVNPANPIDFSKPGVLKASMEKLYGQTVYANHETSVGNELGVVSQVVWQNSYTTDKGIKIPAGINGVLLIDGKANPKIARALSLTPPAIHSNSVSLTFEWAQSHPKMSQEEFFAKLGSRDSEGNLVRRIVVQILAYYETSLVPHGADPFAQQIRESQIVNPVWAKNREVLTANQKQASTMFYYDYTNILALSNNSTLSEFTDVITTNMRDHLILIATLLNIELTDKSDEVLVQEILSQTKELKHKLAMLDTLQAESNQLKQEVASLQDKLNAQQSLVALGEKTKADLRIEAKRIYTILKDGKPEATILSILDNAEVDTLKVLHAEYAEQLEAKFPLSCGDCKSLNVSRASAVVGEPSPTTTIKRKTVKSVFD